MPTRHGMQGDPSDIRRTSPVAFLLLTERMVREARTAQAAAIGDAAVQAFAAALRGLRLLSSAARDAFTLRDTFMATRGRATQPD